MNYPKCSKDLTFYEESGSIHSAPNCESQEFLKDFTCKGVLVLKQRSKQGWSKQGSVLILCQSYWSLNFRGSSSEFMSSPRLWLFKFSCIFLLVSYFCTTFKENQFMHLLNLLTGCPECSVLCSVNEISVICKQDVCAMFWVVGWLISMPKVLSGRARWEVTCWTNWKPGLNEFREQNSLQCEIDSFIEVSKWSLVYFIVLKHTEGVVYASLKWDLCVLCIDIDYVKIH